MGATTRVRSDLAAVSEFVVDRRRRIAYIAVFFLAAGALAVVIPDLRPVVAAAALVLPLRALQPIAVTFDEADYGRFSPVLANVTNYRFAGVTIPLTALPVAALALGIAPDWSEFGSLALVIGAGVVLVLVWSEGIYQKNFYFDRWHPVERGMLVASGLLGLLVTPLFLPLFLVAHRIITQQFRFPGVGRFNYTHSRLPLTLVLVLAAFAIVDLVATVEPTMVLFLLFCGYAAQYFHPGVAKLGNGPLYYLRENNPICMFLNAYKIGWLSGLDEDTVLTIGRYSERIKPLVNATVVLIETGTILVLLWYPLAPVLVALPLLLHVLILLSTGDDFWKWMTTDVFIIVGLVFIVDQPPVVFTAQQWFLFSLPFVVFARAWMNPVGMNWLDVPYVEYFSFEADLESGETVPVHSNVFRPYDSITTQGITGTLTYLGNQPRITYSHGAVTKEANKSLHGRLVGALDGDPPDSELVSEIVEDWGVDHHDEEKTALLTHFLEQFLRTDPTTGLNRYLRYLSSPREFYSAGLSDRESYNNVSEARRLRIYRVDGIWTSEGFEELHRREVLSVEP